jgi:hypothetical protein
MEHLSQSGMLENAWDILRLVAVAAVAGWVTERLLDTVVRTRGLPFLSGLFGLYVGPPLLHMAGWPVHPYIAEQPLIGAFAGALAIGLFLKLATLGAASPRW